MTEWKWESWQSSIDFCSRLRGWGHNIYSYLISCFLAFSMTDLFFSNYETKPILIFLNYCQIFCPFIGKYSSNQEVCDFLSIDVSMLVAFLSFIFIWFYWAIHFFSISLFFSPSPSTIPHNPHTPSLFGRCCLFLLHM